MRVGSLMALIGVIGCGGDGEPPLAPEAGRKVMAAAIDGVVFTAGGVGGLFGDSLDVTACGPSASLGLRVLNVAGPGTFPSS